MSCQCVTCTDAGRFEAEQGRLNRQSASLGGAMLGAGFQHTLADAPKMRLRVPTLPVILRAVL